MTRRTQVQLAIWTAAALTNFSCLPTPRRTTTHFEPLHVGGLGFRLQLEDGPTPGQPVHMRITTLRANPGGLSIDLIAMADIHVAVGLADRTSQPVPLTIQHAGAGPYLPEQGHATLSAELRCALPPRVARKDVRAIHLSCRGRSDVAGPQ